MIHHQHEYLLPGFKNTQFGYCAKLSDDCPFSKATPEELGQWFVSGDPTMRFADWLRIHRLFPAIDSKRTELHMAHYDDNVTIENARIVFRNFAGKQTPYNVEGNRNFAVVLDEKMADAMERDGWNVNRRPPKEEGDDPFNILKVKVNFSGRKPPRVIMLTSRGRTTLDEETAEMLDYADIENVDLIIRPYKWDVNGKTGIKAYLVAIYVTIHEDALERKYADVPEIDSRHPDPEADETGMFEEDFE